MNTLGALETGYADNRTPSMLAGPDRTSYQPRARIRVWRFGSGQGDRSANGSVKWMEMEGRGDAPREALDHIPLDGCFVALWCGEPPAVRYSSRSHVESWKAWMEARKRA